MVIPMKRLPLSELSPVFLQASRVHFPRIGAVGPRTISNWQMVYGLSGRGIYTLSGQRRPASPGRLLIYGPGDVHTIEAAPGESFDALFANFYWHPALAPKAGLVHHMGQGGRRLGPEETAEPARPDFLRSIPILLDLPVPGPFSILFSELVSGLPFYRHHRPLHLKALTWEMFEEIRCAATGTPMLSPSPGLRLREWMERNLARGLSRAEAARDLAMSESTLNNLARAELGDSFIRAMRRLRLTRARDLLALGATTVAKTARTMGFDDPLHFSRLYRAEFGHPPRVDLGRG